MKVNDDGYASINFKDAAALRALTTCLLKEDWGYDVELPGYRLCPTVSTGRSSKASTLRESWLTRGSSLIAQTTYCTCWTYTTMLRLTHRAILDTYQHKDRLS